MARICVQAGTGGGGSYLAMPELPATLDRLFCVFKVDNEKQGKANNDPSQKALKLFIFTERPSSLSSFSFSAVRTSDAQSPETKR